MKNILHQSKKDVFSDWVNNHLASKSTKYIWAQICYDWNTGNILHVVFERNLSNKNNIKWPVLIKNIPVTNLDFTKGAPVLDSGELWDYERWHIKALNCSLSNNPKTEPKSFWDWRIQTRPKGNATCDLDFLCETIDSEYIGIEATEIYFIEESSDVSVDVVEHLHRLFKLRKGAGGGFNFRQLKAQKTFVDMLGGRMYILFHRILKDKKPYTIQEDKCLLLEVNTDNYNKIESIVNESVIAAKEVQATYASDSEYKNTADALYEKSHRVSLPKVFQRFTG